MVGCGWHGGNGIQIVPHADEEESLAVLRNAIPHRVQNSVSYTISSF
jgi:hypothetical protein